MGDKKCGIRTSLLVIVFKVGIIHREPNQVSFVLVKLGGQWILQLWDFGLILKPDVDTPVQVRKYGHDTGCCERTVCCDDIIGVILCVFRNI